MISSYPINQPKISQQWYCYESLPPVSWFSLMHWEFLGYLCSPVLRWSALSARSINLTVEPMHRLRAETWFPSTWLLWLLELSRISLKQLLTVRHYSTFTLSCIYKFVSSDTFPSLVVNGATTSAWVNVRKTNNYNTQSPVRRVSFTACAFRNNVPDRLRTLPVPIWDVTTLRPVPPHQPYLLPLARSSGLWATVPCITLVYVGLTLLDHDFTDDIFIDR